MWSVLSVECSGVWGVECGVWSVECGVWRVEGKVYRVSQSATPATQNDMTTCLKTFKKERLCSFPIDTATPQENQRLETRHVGAEKLAFRARPPLILSFSTRDQTGWNVTKCHDCNAKRHDNLFGNLRKGEVSQLPP